MYNKGNWAIDLALGQKCEKDFTERFMALKPESVFEFNTSKDINVLKEYDLILNGKIKIEVKHDLRAAQTGQIFVEYDCLAYSKSHYFIYKIENDFCCIKQSDLCRLCGRNKPTYCSSVGKYAYFVPLNDLKQLSVII